VDVVDEVVDRNERMRGRNIIIITTSISTVGRNKEAYSLLSISENAVCMLDSLLTGVLEFELCFVARLRSIIYARVQGCRVHG
jgi:hypothetical protein